MKKIIVNKEIKEELDEILEVTDVRDRIGILQFHVKDVWTGYVNLNKLTLEEMAIALTIGYEVEKTPEEELLETYNEIKNLNNFSFDDGYASGIMYTLETLNIKIKGINA